MNLVDNLESTMDMLKVPTKVDLLARVLANLRDKSKEYKKGLHSASLRVTE